MNYVELSKTDSTKETFLLLSLDHIYLKAAETSIEWVRMGIKLDKKVEKEPIVDTTATSKS